MANTSKGKGVTEKQTPETVSERINKRLIEPVRVRHTNPNFCVLTIGKKGDKGNEKIFKGYQTITMQIQEIIEVALITKLFKGEDGNGKNAALYIEDTEVRQYLGFEQVDKGGKVIPQEIMDDKSLLAILEGSSQEKFEEHVESFKDNITKIKLLEDVIKRTQFNNAQRIKYIEKVLDININL